MDKPREPGYYWYKEPEEEAGLCEVYNHNHSKTLRIKFITEGTMSFPLHVIEPGTKFIKIEEPKF